jgi:hypothetical protein
MPLPCVLDTQHIPRRAAGCRTSFSQRVAQEVTSVHAISFHPSAVPAAPSSWSLDSGAQEAQPFLSTHTGHTLAPPVPPRSLLHGKKTSSGSPK